jgi:hypothetical protein
MDDLIAEIDRLHAEATPGPWSISQGGYFLDGKEDEVCNCSYERNGRLIHALLNNWPSLRDRLKAAERKQKAFDAIDTRRIDIVRLMEHRRLIGSSNDLLTAIESALRGEEQSNG